MDAVNHLSLFDISTPLIELEPIQNNSILVYFYGDEFEHVSLGADELGQLRFADLAGLFLEGVDSDAFPGLLDDPVVHPPTETANVHASQTASAVTG